eukprot:5775282-Amphidinium_carterae.2
MGDNMQTMLRNGYGSEQWSSELAVCWQAGEAFECEECPLCCESFKAQSVGSGATKVVPKGHEEFVQSLFKCFVFHTCHPVP